MLVPEAYCSLFEEFEFLLYGFPLPILLAKWLHAGTSISRKLRPSQLHLSLSQLAVLIAPRLGHPPREEGSCCIIERTELFISEGLCLVWASI